MLEPMPVQSPFAAGRNQLVADQRFQDVQPVRPFARGRQRRKPELVQSQLILQKSGHPAGTPLTRPTQSHLAQSDRHHIAIERRGNTILGKQRNLLGCPAPSSKTSIALLHAALWLSLISPRYSTCR